MIDELEIVFLTISACSRHLYPKRFAIKDRIQYIGILFELLMIKGLCQEPNSDNMVLVKL